jgi:uncharacterized membrane protein
MKGAHSRSAHAESVVAATRESQIDPLEAIDILALLVLIGLGGMAAIDSSNGLRVGLALAFILFIPGWATLRFWKSPTLFERLALSVGVSIAVGAASSATALWLHLWRPLPLFYSMAVASGALLAAHVVRERKRSRGSNR